ncbi:hypothetical protein BPY_23100 [Bifidobacterium psychraerophilum]|uniref:hypothetical protein n=1 Tax=Bifidobacterium psychraerophilum TaxID=218140 RepID=UPI00311426DF
MSIAEEESTRKYYLLEGPEHGEGLREKLLDAALENRHVIAQREAYVAGRTAEPTEAEIEAMARLEADEENADGIGCCYDDLSNEDKSIFLATARRLLDAARKAVTQ